MTIIWQPIKTAPKTGETVLVGCDSAVDLARWKDGRWVEAVIDSINFQLHRAMPDNLSFEPTHWTMLTPPRGVHADDA